MNGHTNTSKNHYDVLIVGAGISGINAAYRIQTTLPGATYTILERRDNLGGTWDLFKYPGIRSDSDLFTFGFPWNPWEKPNPIATGESIVEYMKSTAEKFGIDKHFNFRQKVISANWSSDAQHWRLDVDADGQKRVYYANFVILGTGYYNYDKPLDAHIPGLDNFKGTRIHPQFWPEKLNYESKKMVVIGSGATAITLIPALVEKAAKVTMLQRSPSYIMSLPQPKDGEPLPWYQRWLPKWVVQKFKRIQFITIPYLMYLFCRRFPNAARNILTKAARKQLPPSIATDPHFQPAYNPWDQRMCLCPNGDFFKAFQSGKADVITGTIDTVRENDILLKGGETVEADIIITATGLNLDFAGQIDVRVDNNPVKIPDTFLWRYTMLTGVPNLSFIIGYTNASWTLGADSSARLLTRLMKYMKENRYTSATPKIPDEVAKEPKQALDLKSTYVKAGLAKTPKTAGVGPWKPRDNYFIDSWNANRADLRDGLEFKSVST